MTKIVNVEPLDKTLDSAMAALEVEEQLNKYLSQGDNLKKLYEVWGKMGWKCTRGCMEDLQ